MRRRRARYVAAATASLALVASACGAGDDITGIQQDPSLEVGALSLPDIGEHGEPFEFRAEPDSLLLVFFGFTNCPDVCPNTLTKVRAAIGHLDAEAQVQVAMVTVDPARDLRTLEEYVTSFVPDAHALGTKDRNALLAVTNGFGASYVIETLPDGEPDVGHTSYVYGVDDAGRVVVAWNDEVTAEQLASDIGALT